MDDVIRQRDTLHKQLTSIQNAHKQLQKENKVLEDEVFIYLILLIRYIYFNFILSKQKDKFKK